MFTLMFSPSMSAASIVWLALTILLTAAEGYFCGPVGIQQCYKSDKGSNAVEGTASGAKLGSLYRKKLEAEVLTDMDLLGSIADEEGVPEVPAILNIRHQSSDFGTSQETEEVTSKGFHVHSKPNNIGNDFDIVKIINYVKERRAATRMAECSANREPTVSSKARDKMGSQPDGRLSLVFPKETPIYRRDKGGNAVEGTARGAKLGSLYRKKLEAEALTDIDLLGSIADEEGVPEVPAIVNIRHQSSDFGTSQETEEVSSKGFHVHSKPNNIGDDFDIVKIINYVKERRAANRKAECSGNREPAVNSKVKDKIDGQPDGKLPLVYTTETYRNEGLRVLVDKFIPLLRSKNYTDLMSLDDPFLKRPENQTTVKLRSQGGDLSQTVTKSQQGAFKSSHGVTPLLENAPLTTGKPVFTWRGPIDRLLLKPDSLVKKKTFLRRGRGEGTRPDNGLSSFREQDPDVLLAMRKLTDDETKSRDAEKVDAKEGSFLRLLGNVGRRKQELGLANLGGGAVGLADSNQRAEPPDTDLRGITKKERMGDPKSHRELGNRKQGIKEAVLASEGNKGRPKKPVDANQKKIGKSEGRGRENDGRSPEKNEKGKPIKEGQTDTEDPRLHWEETMRDPPDAIRKNGTVDKKQNKKGGFFHSLLNFWRKPNGEGRREGEDKRGGESERVGDGDKDKAVDKGKGGGHGRDYKDRAGKSERSRLQEENGKHRNEKGHTIQGAREVKFNGTFQHKKQDVDEELAGRIEDEDLYWDTFLPSHSAPYL